MGFTLVSGQTAQAQVTGTAITATLPNNPASGNLVVAVICNASGTMSVKDGNNNSFTPTTNTPFLGNSQNVGIFYLLSAPSNASKTITATVPSQTTDIFVAEFSPGGQASGFENNATATNTATTNIILPSYTTLNDGDLLISGCTVSSSILSANSPWTGWPGGIPPAANYAEYFIQSTHGAQAVAYTAVSSSFAALLAAFKLVPSSGAEGIPSGTIFVPGRRFGPTRGLRQTRALPPAIITPPEGIPPGTIFVPGKRFGPTRGLRPTRAFPSGPDIISCSLTVTQADQTLSASGTITLPVASLTVTQGNQALSSSVTVTLPVASLTVTQANQALSASGTVTLPVASLTATQGNQTLSASGTITLPVASLTATQADQTLSASGTVGATSIICDFSATQGNQVLSASGTVTLPVASLTVTQANQALSSGVTVTLPVASLTKTQGNQTLSATGTVTLPVASLTVTEANQTLSASATESAIICTFAGAQTQALSATGTVGTPAISKLLQQPIINTYPGRLWGR